MHIAFPSTEWLQLPTGQDEGVRYGPLAREIVRGLKPYNIVELGTFDGLLYFRLCQEVLDANLATSCFSVSPCAKNTSYNAPQNTAYHDAQTRNLTYSAFSTLLRMDRDEAFRTFDDKAIDILLIDARHFDGSVEDIFRTWTPKLSDCAIIFLHGVSLYDRNLKISQVWAEISTQYPSMTFPNPYGLGVLFWGPKTPDTLGPIVSVLAHTRGHDLIVDYYKKLGEAHSYAALMQARKSSLENDIQKMRQRVSQHPTEPPKWPRRPAQRMKLKIEHQILKALARSAVIVSERAARRLSTSAAKRDPRRDRLSPSGHLEWSYEAIRAEWDKQRQSSKEEVTRLATSLTDSPLISIIATGYDTQPVQLLEMIKSVQAQSYRNWELWITDIATSAPELLKVVIGHTQHDRRVRFAPDAIDGSLTKRIDRAIAEAAGRNLAFVKHCDLLDPDALLLMAKTINDHPDAKVIYSDEDKIGADGQFLEPHFKPDWNRELLYTTNYVSSLCTYDAALVRAVGGVRAGCDDSDNYDLLLRCIEQIEERQIHHIPRVLYHSRVLPTRSTESSVDSIQTTETARRALEEHFEREYSKKIPVVSGLLTGTFRPLWPITGRPLVSIIIPTRDRLGVLRIAVESILEKTWYTNFEILIVDNGSVEHETLSWLAEIQLMDARVRVVRDERSFNYSALNNAAVRQSVGEIVALVNNDVAVISPDWLSEMVALAQRPDIGCVGAKLYYFDDTIQHAGVVIGLGGCAGHGHKFASKDSPGYIGRLMVRQEYSAVTGACLVVRRTIFDAVGGLNEHDLPVAFNDVDFCLKVQKAGYRNLWTPWAQLYHYESISRGSDDTPEKKTRAQKEIAYMQQVWRTNSYRDPAYNPNLTQSTEDFSFATPVWNPLQAS